MSSQESGNSREMFRAALQRKNEKSKGIIDGSTRERDARIKRSPGNKPKLFRRKSGK